jgi:hypothetical protein
MDQTKKTAQTQTHHDEVKDANFNDIKKPSNGFDSSDVICQKTEQKSKQDSNTTSSDLRDADKTQTIDILRSIGCFKLAQQVTDRMYGGGYAVYGKIIANYLDGMELPDQDNSIDVDHLLTIIPFCLQSSRTDIGSGLQPVFRPVSCFDTYPPTTAPSRHDKVSSGKPCKCKGSGWRPINHSSVKLCVDDPCSGHTSTIDLQRGLSPPSLTIASDPDFLLDPDRLRSYKTCHAVGGDWCLAGGRHRAGVRLCAAWKRGCDCDASRIQRLDSALDTAT